MPKERTKILIVGAGQGGLALLEMFMAMETVDILGVVDANSEAPAIKRSQEAGLPTGADYREFIKAKGVRIDAIVNVTGSQQLQKELIGVALPGCEVIGGQSAKLFWELVEKYKVTEGFLRKQQDFLRIIIDSLPNPFLVVDAEDYTIKISNAAARMMGTINDTTKCYELTHNRKDPCAGFRDKCPLGDVKKSKGTQKTEHIHYDNNGDKQYVEVHCSPIIDKDGHVVQFVENHFDITARKAAEKARAEKVKEMEIVYKVTMDREDRILELKERVRVLEKRLGDNL